MTGIFTFHLAQMPARVSMPLLRRPPVVDGLRHAECLALMQLGAPALSPERMQLRRVAMFARWDDEAAIEAFLTGTQGGWFGAGWHVRMTFLRRWSTVSELSDLPPQTTRWEDDEPVVAVTLARMRLPELPRFLSWGRPAERLVRDHPDATLALAAMRPPRSVSTFSIWRSVQSMTDMVHGRTPAGIDHPSRHADAMTERRRRDFHREFATYRFRPLSEHGYWNGQTGYVPWRSNL